MEEIDWIAHRGFSAIAPENTLAAFSAAVEHAAAGIEFDVQLCADRVPVIIHDATLERTTNGSGRVSQKTLAQLRTLDAGTWFSHQFAKERVPTLAETLSLLQPTDVTIYPEVKQAQDWTVEDIEAFLSALLTPAWKNRCVVAAFNSQFLVQVRQLAPQIPLGFEVASAEEFPEQLRHAVACQPSYLLCAYPILLATPSLLGLANNHEIDLVAWTVDNVQDGQRLATLGIKRIITNSLVGSSPQ